MIKTSIFAFSALFLFQFNYAQEKNWNVELNYAIVPADGFGGKDNVIDFGFKYRFLGQSIFNLGLGLNAGIFNQSSTLLSQPQNTTNYILQPRIFSEFNLPFSKKIKPFVGVGYSNILTRGDSEKAFWGFNVNTGLTYDIFYKWLFQVQYDYVSLSAIDNFEGFNNVRLGLGYRF